MLLRASKILPLLLSFYYNIVSSQDKIITVFDINSNLPLIGATVITQGIGTITDENGKAVLTNLVFPLTITVTYIGYVNYEQSFISHDDVPELIYLSPSTNFLDLVTVTGSKYEQDITRATVSIDIIQPQLLKSVNSVSADAILNKVPGVQILDGQANIRGGSGYSYGAGSRVMLLYNDIPVLQPDAGFPNWSDIPIENLSQIEVLKGSSSTLYGSAALNGIINFRSDYAKEKPETSASISNTIFLNPKDIDKKWWGDTTRYELNASFVHKQKVKKLDIIVGGMFNKLEGFNQFTNNRRFRGSVDLRYRFSPSLTFGLNTIYNNSESSSFFIWRSGGAGAYRPTSGTVSDRTANRIYIDPSITYIDKFTNKHKLLTRAILVDNKNNTNQSNESTNYYGEYQFQRDIKKFGLVVSTGFVSIFTTTNSQILGDTTFKAKSYAYYLQLDKKINEKLTIAAGVRYEYVQQNSPEFFLQDTIPNGIASDDQLISKLALNYKWNEYGSIRASYGQGYRYPTLTERFVTTTFGSFSIFSNPKLRPEYGFSTEVGFKQGIKIGSFLSYIDFAAFVSEYEDMIEFTFVFDQTRVGFQPQNIGNTRISGFETSITGKMDLGDISLNLIGGYTYLNPIYKNYNSSEAVRNSVSENQNVLKYRSKHLAKLDISANYKNLNFGFSTQYASNVINIDKAFESVPPINIDLFGVNGFRDLNNKGNLLMDLRLAYKFNWITITALVNNVLNNEISLRPALLEAPRNIGLRLDFTI